MANFHATIPYLPIHFAVCSVLVRNWICSFKTFKTYNLVITSRKHFFSNMAYFGNYQRNSVSIETSSKCTYFTVTLLRADALFFKTKFIIHGVYSNQLFHLMLFLLFKLVFYGLQILKGKHVFRKSEIIYVLHILSSVAPKYVDFSNS